MTTFKMMIYLALIALWCLIALPAGAGEPVGAVERIEGSVDVLREGEAAPSPLAQGYYVFIGDIIRSKLNGKAEIRFKDDTVLQIAPETRIKIDQYSFRGAVRERSFLSLFRGKIRAIVSRVRGAVIPAAAGEANFNIKTPSAVAGVRGSDVITFSHRRLTGVIFRDGHGFVYNPAMPEKIVPIAAGQVTFVTPDAPPLPPRRISTADISLHIKDTSVGGRKPPEEKPAASVKAEERRVAVDVVASNTTSESFIDPKAGLAVEIPQAPVRAAAPPQVPVAVEKPPVDLIPVTETEALLKTPVTVNVKFTN